MSFLINPYRYVSAAPSFDPATLFTGGEVGDFWRFDNVNTNQTVVGGNITTATGLVNAHALAELDAAGSAATLEQVSGNYVARFNSGSDRLAHNFGSTIAQPGTIIVCMSNGSLETQVVVTGSAAGSRWQISMDSSDNFIAFAGSTLDSTLNSPVASTPKVFTVEFNGASSVFRSNGTQVATGNAGAQGTNQITVGALYDGNAATIGDIYSVLFIDRLLTSDERDDVERWMGSHAGVSW